MAVWGKYFVAGIRSIFIDTTMKFRLCLFFLSAFVAQASATVVSLNPTEDAFVSSANPNSNYGGAGALAVSGSALSKGEFDSLLQFDFSSATTAFNAAFGTGLWAITSVSLQLTATAPNNALFNGNGAGSGGGNTNFAGQFSINWLQNDAWTEGTGTPASPGSTGITFTTLPSFQSGADETLGTNSFSGATSGSTSWSLSLQSSFLSDAMAGNSVSLLLLPADTGIAYLTDSRSFGTTGFRPLLTVSASAVPEPSTKALLAIMALVALGVAAWRRRRDSVS